MDNAQLVDMLQSATIEVLAATLIFWGHRRLNVRVSTNAIFLAASYLILIVNAYNLLFDLPRLFPQRFTWPTVILVAGGIILVCLLAGFCLDRVLRHFKRWG